VIRAALPRAATNRNVERAFDEPFAVAGAESIGWMPAMEIVETPKELTVTAELAGIDPKDIDVSVDDGVLTVRGEKSEERTEDGTDKKVYLYERNYGCFQRAFALPTTVDGSKITAEVDKGVLKVHLPKSDGAQPKGRKIAIKST
jgi:HSP20 family protein